MHDAFLKEWLRINTDRSCYGSTGSRLLTGNSQYIEELEYQIAAFHGYQAAALFHCGYMANVGLVSILGKPHDTLLFDAHIHASTRNGYRHSKTTSFAFRHNDLEHLESRLKRSTGTCFICIESVYSTDGSLAPLSEICSLAKQYHAHVIVDEAHAIGVYGPSGKGLVAAHNLSSDVFALVVTCGKALGTQGAFVLGSNTLKQAIINFSNPFIYTTAPSFYSLAAISCSYQLFPAMEYERHQIQKLIHRFQTLSPQASYTHIQPIFIQGNDAVKTRARELQKQGYDVRALTSPTVGQGRESLRICLHAYNTEQEIEELLTR